MPRLPEDWRTRLAKLPPTTHISFSQQKSYWVADWWDQEQSRHLYIGKQAPDDHPCFDGRCGHPYRKRGQPQRVSNKRDGRALGYQPGPETIERQRQVHLGRKRTSTQQPGARKTQGNRRLGEITPTYLKIADQLAAEIRQGAYLPGQALPNPPCAAERYGVSATTIGLAYQEVLRRGGLIFTRRGEGFFVRQKGLPQSQEGS